MPEIDRQLFTGSEKLNAADWFSISAPDASAAAVGGVLKKFGWDGGAAAAVALPLSPDNSAVVGARLMLLGSWDKAVKIQAKKLFVDCDEDVLLTVDNIDLAALRCPANTVASRYTESRAFNCKYSQAGKTLDEDDLIAQNVGDVCIRAVTRLASSCGSKHGMWLQVTLLIFPLGAEQMAAGAEGQNPAWPGIKLAEGQVPLLPAAGKGTAAAGGKIWGCPLAPIIVPGAPWEAAPITVQGLRHAAQHGVLAGGLHHERNALQEVAEPAGEPGQAGAEAGGENMADRRRGWTGRHRKVR